jgi:putative Mg2+ transporter-C (MgtC) family protein
VLDAEVLRFTLRDELTMLARLVVAATAGGLIGWERRASGHLVGIRTLSLVATGSAIFALVSAVGFLDADPARVAAGVATGVGFIGAGTILVRGGTLHGLTTAAAIWASAALGLAAGAGMYVLALGGAVLVTAILVLLPRGVMEQEAGTGPQE